MGWEWDGRERERRKGRERQERGYSPKLQFLAPPLLTAEIPGNWNTVTRGTLT